MIFRILKVRKLRYIFLLIIVLLTLSGFGQAGTKVFRIANATTNFSESLPHGTIVIDLNTNECYLILTAIAAGQSLSDLTEGVSYKHIAIESELQGDDWGSDVVNSDITLSGEGTSSSPLKVDTTLIATKNDFTAGTMTASFANLSADTLTIDSMSLDAITYSNTYYNDVLVNPYTAKLKASAEPDWVNFGASQVLSFEEGDQVYFTVQLPHSYKEGSDLHFHLHVVYTDYDVTHDASWTLDYTWANVYSAFPGSSTTITNQTYPSSATANYHDIASIGSLTGTGKKISSVLTCSLKRNSGGSNISAIYVLSMDFHMEMNKPGTDFEFK